MTPRKRRAPEERRKKVTIKLLKCEHAGQVTEPYRIMETIIGKYHEHLQKAAIAIAWRIGWKTDADGVRKLGQCKKGSDLDREMHGYDFVILLNYEVWKDVLTPEQKMALMDHNLAHAMAAVDSNGDQKLDENGRLVWRLRRHDLEEFTDVVTRHGCYLSDIERFVQRAMEAKELPLLEMAK